MIIKPPKQRIRWEANRIIEKAIENKVLLDKHKDLKPEEIIATFDPTLLEYLNSIYSYDSHCSIKIYQITSNEKDKILKKIKHEEEFNRLKDYPKIFDEDEIELNERYLSKIDELNNNYNNYYRFWYVSFKQGKYSFGFNQEKTYIATIRENIFLYDNLIILRSQANNLPNLRDTFIADFGINKTELVDLTHIDLLTLFDKLKQINNNCKITTSEITKENPISGVPAHCITFSEPLDEDIEEFDEEDETAQMINEAQNLAKSYNYCFTDISGYKECAKISINKKNKHIRILKKISDIAIFNLAKEIERAYNEMQQNLSNISNS